MPTDANTAPVDSELHRFPDATELPLVIHRGVLVEEGDDTARNCERLFGQNGWLGAWQNGIYPYHHFHATTHEVLGIAKGEAAVRFGGDEGPLVTIRAGDVVIIPAGVSHRREGASEDLLVVGAYPGGAEPDIEKEVPVRNLEAANQVPDVSLPDADPVFGPDGPLLRHWSRTS
jgi:uncharacterized protein YjlB